MNFKSFFNFLNRNKAYTAINIFGLSVSLMFAIIVAVFSINEFSTDKFQKNGDRVYVLGNGEWSRVAYNLKDYIEPRYPEIEKICRLYRTTASDISQDDEYSVRGSLLFADSTFFDVFSFKFTEGHLDDFLNAKENVILSRKFALKLFGDADPVGRQISINRRKFLVCGIMEDIENSFVPYSDVLMRIENVSNYNSSIPNQLDNAAGITMFIMAKEGSDLPSRIPEMEEYFKTFFWTYQRGISEKVSLTPLSEAYFTPLDNWEMRPEGSYQTIFILISVSLAILIFAIINYINLTVSQSGFRAREMATRRLLGATRGQIIFRLIAESVLMCAVAFAIGLLLAYAFEAPASALLEKEISLDNHINAATITTAIAGILLTGTICGIVPAVLISNFKPIDVVRGTFARKTKMTYSRIFIVFQNVITIVLIAASITMVRQINHIGNKELGIKTENIIVVSRDFRNNSQLQAFRDRISELTTVSAIAGSQSVPLAGVENTSGEYNGKFLSVDHIVGDSAFFKMLGFEIVQYNGGSDPQEAGYEGLWLNEQAFREMEMDYSAQSFKYFNQEIPITGIIRDFNFRDLSNQPSPVKVIIDKKARPHYILVKYEGDPVETFDKIKEIYQDITKREEINAYFWDKEIAAYYHREKMTSLIISVFTVIAIIISSLGLIAMSFYFLRQRSMEVAIRKIFGSTSKEILISLVTYFMKLVAVAFIISVPVIYFAMSSWLRNYPERIKLGPSIFILAGIFAFVIAFVSVFIQTSRAANANPVDSIKK